MGRCDISPTLVMAVVRLLWIISVEGSWYGVRFRWGWCYVLRGERGGASLHNKVLLDKK